ncbi:variable large family protein [Borrelia persica]|uniref:variable large family protein n=1 Tax=Borrelia persica TaxID=44448 RepID=UPI0004634732
MPYLNWSSIELDGKFADYKGDDNTKHSNYVEKVKEAAVKSVNKVLGVLDVIIMQILQIKLSKIKNKIK